MKASIHVLGLCLVFGCADDDRVRRDAAGLDGGGIDSGEMDSGGADAGGADASGCACAAGEGCLVFELSRSADDANLPWVAFGGDADGMGTMIVGALDSSDFSEVARMEFAAQDLTDASWTLSVDLGCVPARALEARAFLDDNLNTSGGVTSSDFIDACLDGRRVDVTVVAGTTTTAMGEMAQSCD